jgi:hypothetical protein
MASEKQLAGLTPFKPGQPSANPNGRPKGSKNKKTVLAKLLHIKTVAKNPLTGKRERMTYLEQMFLVQIKKAIRGGDVNSFRALMERFEGTAMKYSEMLSLEMAQTSGWSGEEIPQAAAGTTIIRRIVFKTLETSASPQIVNE